MKTRRRGFTLIELLTVIAIIGILAAIVIPTVGKVRKSAQKAKCVSNLRQISMGLINLAQANKAQRFPKTEGGFIAWDVKREVLVDLFGAAARQIMYCPSGQLENQDQMWDGFGLYAATQYVLLLEGNTYVPAKYRNDYMRSSYTVDAVEIPSSRRELAVDALVLSGGQPWESGITKNRTNHMNGAKAEGVNVAFVDGHVSWRAYPTGVTPKAPGTPVFYW